LKPLLCDENVTNKINEAITKTSKILMKKKKKKKKKINYKKKKKKKKGKIIL